MLYNGSIVRETKTQGDKEMKSQNKAVNWMIEKGSENSDGDIVFSGCIPSDMLKKIDRFVRSLPEDCTHIVNDRREQMFNWKEDKFWFGIDISRGRRGEKSFYNGDYKKVVFQCGVL